MLQRNGLVLTCHIDSELYRIETSAELLTSKRPHNKFKLCRMVFINRLDLNSLCP